MSTHKTLTVHIILSDKKNWASRHSFFVALESARYINEFRRILHKQSREKAMVFALCKGRRIDSSEVNGSQHVLLTENGTHWDLM